MAADRQPFQGRMIYLDYQATTPVAPEVAEAMRPWIEEKFANPHSPSRWGREAAAAIEVARGQVGAHFPAGTLAFTSGATEALNWALKGTFELSERRKLVTVVSEHAAVLDTAEWLQGEGIEVVALPVGNDGVVDLVQANDVIDDQTALVAVMLVNNEIGVLQPVAEIARLARDKGALMLCDAVQGFGRLELPDGPDFFAISSHKVHGPKGVGALWIRDGVTPPAPLLHGGGQEQGLRSGTLSPALCAGFGEAARLASERQKADQLHVSRLWDLAMDVFGPDWSVNGSLKQRYRGNLNIRRDGLDGARLIGELRDIAFSLGSACASGSGRPSHVLRALGLADRQARSSIRLGFGRYTSEEELVDACRRIDAAARAQESFAA
jgi:cysteine desulfurase